MGTSQPSNGPLNKTPLVPSWLPDDSTPTAPDGDQNTDGGTDQLLSPEENTPPKDSARPVIEIPPQPRRYQRPRSQFKDYVRGNSVAGRKAIGGYVRKGAGGAKNAVKKMGGARKTAGNIVQVFQSIQNNGLSETLNNFNLSSLSGKSPVEICIGLTEVICHNQHGGPIDEAIARDAWLDTVSTLSDLGIANLEDLTTEQVEAVFIEFVTNSIQCRIIQDIGTETLEISDTIAQVEDLEVQLHEYVHNTVKDSFSVEFENMTAWNEKDISGIVDDTYLSTFNLLEDNEDEQS